MANEKKYEIDMCNGPILSKLLLFALPLMFSSILQILFNAADIIVVGRYAGDNALAAVGSNTSLINLLTNLFVGLSIGANVMAAREYGAKNEEELSKTVHTSMVVSIVSGMILTLIGILGAKQILLWMSSPEEVIDLAACYLRIYFLGMTSTMIYNFGSAILRAIGDTKRPLYYLAGAGVINVILNLIFVVGFHLGVIGVGAATAISQTISAVCIFRCMLHEKGGIQITFSKLRFNLKKFIEILKIGLPAGIQGILFSMSNVLIQSSINSFGAVVVAGNSAASNLEGFVYFGMNAFYQATISFTSQNFGAGNVKRIKKVLLTAQMCVVFVGLLLGQSALFFGNKLLRIYSSSEPVIEAGLVRLGVVSRTYALCGVMDVMVGALRGIGYSIMPMIVSLMGACVFRVIWLSTVFRMPQFHTTRTVYLSYPVSWVITLTIHIGCFIWAYRKLVRSSR